MPRCSATADRNCYDASQIRRAEKSRITEPVSDDPYWVACRGLLWSGACAPCASWSSWTWASRVVVDHRLSAQISYVCRRQRARLSLYGVPLIRVFEHTYARPLYTPVAPSGAQNDPGRRLVTTGDPPGVTVVEVLADATVVALDRPVLDRVVDRADDRAADGAPPATSDQPRIVVPAH
jgi:hypothetical protein